MQPIELRQSNTHLAHEVQDLKMRLNRITQEKETLEQKINEIQLHDSQLVHSNRILEKDVTGLSKQVANLLSHIEVLQGQRKTNGTIDGGNVFPLNSETLMHSRLTSFRDIEELQQQNLKLNRALQELSSLNEAEESKKQERINYLESTLLNKAQPSIEQLKSALISKSQIAKTLKGENEVLRSLAEVDPDFNLPQLEEVLKSRAAGKDACPPVFVKRFEEQLTSEREKCKSLQNEMASLRQVSHQMKTDYEVRISELDAGAQALKENLTRESKIVEKLKSDLNLNLQKQTVLNSDAASVKEKVNELQAKIVRLETELGQVIQAQETTKQLLESAQADKMHLQDQLSQTEAQNAGLRKEYELLSKKASEDAATSSSAHESFQTELKQLSFERTGLITQIKELQDRILAQGARHEQGLQEYICKVEDLTYDLSASRVALEESQASFAEASTAKELAEKEVVRLSELVAASSVGEAQLIKTYSAKLQLAQADIEELRSNENQYRTIAQAAEESLRINIQKSNEDKIQLNQDIQKQKKLLEQAEKEASLSLVEAQERSAQSQAALEKLEAEKTQLTNELRSAQAQHESTHANLEAAQNMVKQLENKVTASESAALALEEKQRKFHSQLNEVKAQSLLKENQAATQWATEREALVREMDTLSQTISELRLIVESLAGKTRDPKGLIAFLRQEKDRAEGGLQSCVINNKRLQAEIEVANAALVNTRKLLEEPHDEIDELRADLHDRELRIQQLSDANKRLEMDNLRLAQSKAQVHDESLQSLDLELKDKEIAMLKETNLRNTLQIQKLLEKPTNIKFLQLKDSNTALLAEVDSLKDEIKQNKIDATQLSDPKETKTKVQSRIKRFHDLAKQYKDSAQSLTDEVNAQKALLSNLRSTLELEDDSPEGLLQAVQLLKRPADHGVREDSPELSNKRLRNDSPKPSNFLKSPAILPQDNEKSD